MDDELKSIATDHMSSTCYTYHHLIELNIRSLLYILIINYDYYYYLVLYI